MAARKTLLSVPFKCVLRYRTMGKSKKGVNKRKYMEATTINENWPGAPQHCPYLDSSYAKQNVNCHISLILLTIGFFQETTVRAD